MNQFTEFFANLFSTSDWPARWFCGTWSSFHGWLYILSDVAIWLAYFFIPVIIILFIQKRPNIPFLPVFWLFGAFILLCGMTHILDALIFWWPAYRLAALLKFLTALLSIVTVLALIRDLPKLLDITSKNHEKDINTSAPSLILKKDQEIEALKLEIQRLKADNE